VFLSDHHFSGRVARPRSCRGRVQQQQLRATFPQKTSWQKLSRWHTDTLRYYTFRFCDLCKQITHTQQNIFNVYVPQTNSISAYNSVLRGRTYLLGMVLQGLTSHSTHYRSFRRRYLLGHVYKTMQVAVGCRRKCSWCSREIWLGNLLCDQFDVSFLFKYNSNSFARWFFVIQRKQLSRLKEVDKDGAPGIMMTVNVSNKNCR